MQYSINLTDTAQRFLDKCDRKIKDRILEKIGMLREYPELGKPLVGKMKGLWSLRAGDYRAIYYIKNNELIIIVVRIGHRKNIYD